MGKHGRSPDQPTRRIVRPDVTPPDGEIRRRAWPVVLVAGLALAAAVGIVGTLFHLSSAEQSAPKPSFSYSYVTTPTASPADSPEPITSASKKQIKHTPKPSPAPAPTVTKTITKTVITPGPAITKPGPTITRTKPGPTKTVDRCFAVELGEIADEIECP